MAGVGEERFDVPPLAFSVERRSSRERRFAGARDPGDDHEPVAGIVTLTFLRLCWRVRLMRMSFIFSEVQVDAGIWRSEDWGT